MDFDDSPAEATYRAKARDWLAAHAPLHAPAIGSVKLDESRAWQRAKADAGYACITWSPEWGGEGGTQLEAMIFHAEAQAYNLPLDVFEYSLAINLPTLMTLSDAATRERFAGPAKRGEELWCQLLSEPSNGSDLAAARTRAVRADDGSGDWILNGQKVWTTFAQIADFGIVLARTDPDVPKHLGLTMFWHDMRAPGVTVKPIHQMSGSYEFNEVFLTDLRIKDSQRLGAVGDGWNSSLTMLMFERMALGGGRSHDWPEFMTLARSVATRGGGTALNDQAVRERIAEWYVQSEGLKHIRNRTMTALSHGGMPGPENSIGKIIAANQTQSMASAAVELLDQYGIIDDPAYAPSGSFHEALLTVPGLRIAGGTDEILKNIIAERVLGLPGDIRVDKSVAYRDIPRGV